MIKVYRIRYSNMKADRLMSYPLDSLMDETIKTYKGNGEEAGTMIRCPIFTGWMKNTFIFRSPYDIEMGATKDGRIRLDYPKVRDKKEFMSDAYGKHKNGEMRDVVELNDIDVATYFCEQELVMEVTSPALEKENLPVIPCKMDIGSWARSFHVALFTVHKKIFHIKEGQPLAYIRFMTDEPVKVVDIDASADLDKMLKSVAQIRKVTIRRPLKSLYKLFHQSGMQRRIVEEVKRLEKIQYGDTK